MKKVTHIITTISRGGAENQLITLAQEQISSGWQVAVIYLKDAPELIKDFRKIGVEVIEQCAKYRVIRQIFWLKNYFKINKCVIHAHLPRAEILTALAAQKNSFVFTRHNSEAFFPNAPQGVSSFLSRFVSNRAKSGIAISKAVEDFIRSKNEISNKCGISIIYYGFNTIPIKKDQHSLPGKHANINKDDFVFGTIGRIVPQKDYPTLLKAFNIVAKDQENCKLLIVGDGYLKNEMEDLVDNLGLTSKVIWFGRTDKVIETLNLMDCFVLTSKYEGFGLVLLEAMSAKVPIIASNASAIPEVLGNDYPFLSTPGDLIDFAKKMKNVKNLDKNQLAELQIIQTRRLQMFDPKTMNSAITKIYSEIKSK